jgi:hypothetical protein
MSWNGQLLARLRRAFTATAWASSRRRFVAGLLAAIGVAAGWRPRPGRASPAESGALSLREAEFYRRAGG